MSEVTAVVPWFGSSRTVASQIGKELTGLRWLGLPFAGGMCELQHVDCRSIAVNDLHRHVMNLARVISTVPEFTRRLTSLPFHPDVLERAQAYCLEVEYNPDQHEEYQNLAEEWAMYYFVTQWMGRSGNAGTDKEFTGGISTRWTSTGGDSNTRYRSAIRSLVTWRQIMRRCSFTTLDAFDFLLECKDMPGHGIYSDCPWPGDGDGYKHKFTDADQKKLADLLSTFTKARVVIRFGEHPRIRELYPASHWDWRLLKGRTQGNNDKAEVLITNRVGK